MAGSRAAPRGGSRPSAPAHRPAAGGATGLDQDQHTQMYMWRLPWTGRVPDCAGSTAMAPEGGPGSEDSCRAKRPKRGVRPRPDDRKARQPPHTGRDQEPGQLRTASKAAAAKMPSFEARKSSAFRARSVRANAIPWFIECSFMGLGPFCKFTICLVRDGLTKARHF